MHSTQRWMISRKLVHALLKLPWKILLRKLFRPDPTLGSITRLVQSVCHRALHCISAASRTWHYPLNPAIFSPCNFRETPNEWEKLCYFEGFSECLSCRQRRKTEENNVGWPYIDEIWIERGHFRKWEQFPLDFEVTCCIFDNEPVNLIGLKVPWKILRDSQHALHYTHLGHSDCLRIHIHGHPIQSKSTHPWSSYPILLLFVLVYQTGDEL
ncbi:hypothetical protein Y032_0096g2904 [Ancylostoma ceylanicum]|uniref:Uncharacterized protein n=2 Tax=Ancylostoma ceylanicum TaxID=53326 RepID=A0A016TJ85_9BILA|nr:hypothetical protein Y032_0096g2904 [Ancylostoma ceylanicum]